jgi:hypothetical protein
MLRTANRRYRLQAKLMEQNILEQKLEELHLSMQPEILPVVQPEWYLQLELSKHELQYTICR